MAIGRLEGGAGWDVHEFGGGRRLLFNLGKNQFYVVENPNTPKEKLREPNETELRFIIENFPRPDGGERVWQGPSYGVEVADAHLAKAILDTMRAVQGEVEQVAPISDFSAKAAELTLELDRLAGITTAVPTEAEITALKQSLSELKPKRKDVSHNTEFNNLSLRVQAEALRLRREELSDLNTELTRLNGIPSATSAELYALKVQAQTLKNRAKEEKHSALIGTVDTLVNGIDTALQAKEGNGKVSALQSEISAIDIADAAERDAMTLAELKAEERKVAADMKALNKKATALGASYTSFATDSKDLSDYLADLRLRIPAKETTDKTESVRSKIAAIPSKTTATLDGMSVVDLRAEADTMDAQIASLRKEAIAAGGTAPYSTFATEIAPIETYRDDLRKRVTALETNANPELLRAQAAVQGILDAWVEITDLEAHFGALSFTVGSANFADAASLAGILSSLQAQRTALSEHYGELRAVRSHIPASAAPGPLEAAINTEIAKITTGAPTLPAINEASGHDMADLATLEHDLASLRSINDLLAREATRLAMPAPANTLEALQAEITFRQETIDALPATTTPPPLPTTTLGSFLVEFERRSAALLATRIEPVARALVSTHDARIAELQTRATNLRTTLAATPTPAQLARATAELGRIRRDVESIETQVQAVEIAVAGTPPLVNLSAERAAFDALSTELQSIETGNDASRATRLLDVATEAAIQIGAAAAALIAALAAYNSRMSVGGYALNPLGRTADIAAMRTQLRNAEAALNRANALSPEIATIAARNATNPAVLANCTSAQTQIAGLLPVVEDMRTSLRAVPVGAQTLLDTINAGAAEGRRVGGETVPAFDVESLGEHLTGLRGGPAIRSYVQGIDMPAVRTRYPSIHDNSAGLTALTGPAREAAQREILQFLGLGTDEAPNYAAFRARLRNHHLAKLAEANHAGQASEANAAALRDEFVQPLYEAFEMETGDHAAFDTFFEGMAVQTDEDRRQDLANTAWRWARNFWLANTAYAATKAVVGGVWGVGTRVAKGAGLGVYDFVGSIINRSREGVSTGWNAVGGSGFESDTERGWFGTGWRGALAMAKTAVITPFVLAGGLAYGAVAGGTEGSLRAAGNLAGISYDTESVEQADDLTPASIAEKCKEVLGEESAAELAAMTDLDEALSSAATQLESKAYDAETFFQSVGILESKKAKRFIDRFSLADHGVLSAGGAGIRRSVDFVLSPLHALKMPLVRDAAGLAGWAFNFDKVGFGGWNMSALRGFLPSIPEDLDWDQSLATWRQISPKFRAAYAEADGRGMTRVANALATLNDEDLEEGSRAALEVGGYTGGWARFLPYLASGWAGFHDPERAYRGEELNYDRFLSVLGEDGARRARLINQIDVVQLLNRYPRIMDARNTVANLAQMRNHTTNENIRSARRTAEGVLTEMRSFFGRANGEPLSRVACERMLTNFVNTLDDSELEQDDRDALVAATENVRLYVEALDDINDAADL